METNKYCLNYCLRIACRPVYIFNVAAVERRRERKCNVLFSAVILLVKYYSFLFLRY